LITTLAEPSGNPPGEVTTPSSARLRTVLASVWSPFDPASTAASL